MLSVTLDTNIYVSALEFGGLGARLLGMARALMFRIGWPRWQNETSPRSRDGENVRKE